MKRLDPTWDPVLAAAAILAIAFWWKVFLWVSLAVLVVVALFWRFGWPLVAFGQLLKNRNDSPEEK
jgi:F0F1-type ATP synthase membrane subunit b/b'